MAQWWGPRGFTITTHRKELRVGGTWRYTMHGPDGVDCPNVTRYLVVEPLERLVYDHGGTDDTPPLFRVSVTFAESDGKTTMDMVMALASAEAAVQIAAHVKRVGGEATWDRLAEHLAAEPTFVLNRSFDSPIARVFEMWTNPAHLAKWLPPVGTEMAFLRAEIAPGNTTFFVITGPQGVMHVRVAYLVIEPPHEIIYDQQFVDDQERLVASPEPWPATLRNTVRFAEEGPGRTRVTLTTALAGAATAAEVAAFVVERSGMTIGWTGSFDKLEELVAAG